MAKENARTTYLEDTDSHKTKPQLISDNVAVLGNCFSAVETVYRVTGYRVALWKKLEVGYVFSGTNRYPIGSLWIQYIE